MKKITAWAKGHKIAAVFVGAGSLVVVGFAFIVALGLILMAAGVDVEPEVEPTAQVAKAEPEAEKKPESKAPEKTKAPEPKKTQETKKAEPKKTAAPKAEKPKPSPKTEKPKPKKAPAKPAKTETEKRAEQIQKDLAIFFECDWSNDTTEEDGIVRVDICKTEDVLLGTGSDVALNVWADNISEEVPTAYKVVGKGYTVITGTQGQANQAWDMLGADGEVLPIK